MFNMNFTKDLVLCEIIERHKSESIVVKKMYCRLIIQNDSYDCHGVCMNECKIPIITLLNLSDHLLSRSLCHAHTMTKI